MGFQDEAKDIFAKTVEKVPNLFIVFGAIFFGLAYTSVVNSEFHFPESNPKSSLIVIGIAFIIIGLALYVIFRSKQTKKLKDNTTLKFNSTTLTIKIGSIQDVESPVKDGTFVLPANTTFVDDCITDNKSALGSFFGKHHPEKIPDFNQRLKAILQDNNIHSSTDGIYDPATVLILPDEYNVTSKVILVASAIKNPGIGFYTTPSIINDSICNVFKKTADKRINTFYLPIIGSGHAGMEITSAFNLLILFIKFHTKQFHHVKNLYIFVRKSDRKKINASFLDSL